jgi:hypothetical protein
MCPELLGVVAHGPNGMQRPLILETKRPAKPAVQAREMGS